MALMLDGKHFRLRRSVAPFAFRQTIRLIIIICFQLIVDVIHSIVRARRVFFAFLFLRAINLNP